MKTLARLKRAWHWWRIGVSAKKAWLLAAPAGIRKQSYSPEVLVIFALLAAYAAVGYTDRRAAEDQAALVKAQHAKLEANVVKCLNGQALLLDQKTWVQCYTSTVM